MKEGVGKFI